MSAGGNDGLRPLPGSAQAFDNYRNYVGSEDKYDLVGAMQFNLLSALGLREHHRLLDLGCGSLRAGRLFIPYLQPQRYFGIDPNLWLVDEGIAHHLGKDVLALKQPRFLGDDSFDLTAFGEAFDFILAQSIFTHTSPAQNRACLAQVKRTLAPGGLFVVDYFDGPASYAGDQWVYPGVVEYTLPDLERWCREAGLRCQPIRWRHPNGMRWLVIQDADAPARIELTDDAGPMVGNFDGASQLFDHVWQLHGWTVDRSAPGRPIELLLADAAGRVLARASTGLDRPDVVAFHADPTFAGAGWRVTATTAAMPVGRHEVRAYALGLDGRTAHRVGALALELQDTLAG